MAIHTYDQSIPVRCKHRLHTVLAISLNLLAPLDVTAGPLHDAAGQGDTDEVNFDPSRTLPRKQ